MNNVVVAIEEKFNPDFGAYAIAWLWNGETISSKCVGDYFAFSNEELAVNASASQIQEAGEAYRIQIKDKSPINYADTYIGCEVMIKGSRKVPNGIYTVTNHKPRFFNGRFYTQEQVYIQCENQIAQWISVSCIHEVVKGAYPYWYNPKL